MKKKIKNIKKSFVSLALVLSTSLTGLGLIQRAYASETTSESYETSIGNNTYDNIDHIKSIFQSYVINYKIVDNDNSPQFSEYYSIINEIYNRIKNCEKNKLSPYSEDIILKASIMYTKEYFNVLNENGKINIPDNIGNNIYDVLPIVAITYQEPTEEELDEVAKYDDVMKNLMDFYRFVNPTLSKTINENGLGR